MNLTLSYYYHASYIFIVFVSRILYYCITAGGYIVIGVGENYLKVMPELKNLEKQMENHVKEGKWQWVRRRSQPRTGNIDQNSGVLFVFQVT